ncbi:MAG: SRPBCC family protein [Planctomycetaceae bacterium]|nr:SRPBCC family protein [Planctomycetaceae bacterium]
MNHNESHATTSGREIVITRLIQAPRERVFDAWTDLRHLAIWWGPNGFTTTTDSIDVRPGGVWRFVMHGPDGRDYQNQITYLEVVRPERLRYRHGGVEDVDVDFHTTVTFEEVGDQTRVTLQSVFHSAEELARAIREYGADEGGKQHLGRLALYVEADPATAEREIVTTRLIDAPREKVFRAWTEPEHLQRWWGPTGFTNTFHEFDLQPGGHWRFIMHGPNGVDHPNHSLFVEIVPPERIVFDHLSVHLFRVVATFVEEAGQTRVTFRMIHESAEECRKLRPLCVPANEQLFDRLEAELARMN